MLWEEVMIIIGAKCVSYHLAVGEFCMLLYYFLFGKILYFLVEKMVLVQIYLDLPRESGKQVSN